MPIFGVNDAAFPPQLVEEVRRFRVANVGRPHRFKMAPMPVPTAAETIRPLAVEFSTTIR